MPDTYVQSFVSFMILIDGDIIVCPICGLHKVEVQNDDH